MRKTARTGEIVVGFAHHSETMELMVVYRAFYGEHGLWVRPASMWNETVERDGKVYQRFTYLGDDKAWPVRNAD